MESIIVALITGGLSFLAVVITTRKQHDETISQVKTEIALVKKDINTLDANVKKHNGLIERTYALEKAVSVIEERQKTINHRIADLEDDAK